jgi:hypothetical protein
MTARTMYKEPGARPDNTELVALTEATVAQLDTLGEAVLALAVSEDGRRDVGPMNVVIKKPMKVVIYTLADGRHAVANVPRSYVPFDTKPDLNSLEAHTRYFTDHAEALKDAKARHGGGAHVVDEARRD